MDNRESDVAVMDRPSTTPDIPPQSDNLSEFAKNQIDTISDPVVPAEDTAPSSPESSSKIITYEQVVQKSEAAKAAGKAERTVRDITRRELHRLLSDPEVPQSEKDAAIVSSKVARKLLFDTISKDVDRQIASEKKSAATQAIESGSYSEHGDPSVEMAKAELDGIKMKLAEFARIQDTAASRSGIKDNWSIRSSREMRRKLYKNFADELKQEGKTDVLEQLATHDDYLAKLLSEKAKTKKVSEVPQAAQSVVEEKVTGNQENDINRWRGLDHPDPLGTTEHTPSVTSHAREITRDIPQSTKDAFAATRHYQPLASAPDLTKQPGYQPSTVVDDLKKEQWQAAQDALGKSVREDAMTAIAHHGLGGAPVDSALSSAPSATPGQSEVSETPSSAPLQTASQPFPSERTNEYFDYFAKKNQELAAQNKAQLRPTDAVEEAAPVQQSQEDKTLPSDNTDAYFQKISEMSQKLEADNKPQIRPSTHDEASAAEEPVLSSQPLPSDNPEAYWAEIRRRAGDNAQINAASDQKFDDVRQLQNRANRPQHFTQNELQARQAGLTTPLSADVRDRPEEYDFTPVQQGKLGERVKNRDASGEEDEQKKQDGGEVRTSRLGLRHMRGEERGNITVDKGQDSASEDTGHSRQQAEEYDQDAAIARDVQRLSETGRFDELAQRRAAIQTELQKAIEQRQQVMEKDSRGKIRSFVRRHGSKAALGVLLGLGIGMQAQNTGDETAPVVPQVPAAAMDEVSGSSVRIGQGTAIVPEGNAVNVDVDALMRAEGKPVDETTGFQDIGRAGENSIAQTGGLGELGQQNTTTGAMETGGPTLGPTSGGMDIGSGESATTGQVLAGESDLDGDGVNSSMETGGPTLGQTSTGMDLGSESSSHPVAPQGEVSSLSGDDTTGRMEAGGPTLGETSAAIDISGGETSSPVPSQGGESGLGGDQTSATVPGVEGVTDSVEQSVPVETPSIASSVAEDAVPTETESQVKEITIKPGDTAGEIMFENYLTPEQQQVYLTNAQGDRAEAIHAFLTDPQEVQNIADIYIDNLDVINKSRVDQGFAPLTENDIQRTADQVKAGQLSADNFWRMGDTVDVTANTGLTFTIESSSSSGQEDSAEAPEANPMNADATGGAAITGEAKSSDNSGGNRDWRSRLRFWRQGGN